jgi:hypothetical protein
LLGAQSSAKIAKGRGLRFFLRRIDKTESGNPATSIIPHTLEGDRESGKVANAADVQLARQRVGEVLLSLPKTMMESADMIIILNARGTVLLNPSFDGLDQQWRIVALAMLAVDLW